MLIWFIFALFFVAVIRKLLFWTALWQTKEYRWDRLWVHIQETTQGRALFTSSVTIFGSLLILLYIVVVVFDWFAPFYQIFVVSFFLLYAFDFGKQVLDRKVKRPVFTYKSILIVGLSLVGSIILFLFPLTDKYVWILILLGIAPFIVALWVGIFSFPSEIYTDFISQKAQRKIKQLKNLTVIAISGSYGKSSTKEAVAHMLSQKFSVVKTPLSNNTPIGVAKTILKSITEDTNFFIVEMGAYKKGELAQLCAIVQPDISITTAVSDQHISLYGNFDNVILSERELIHALAKNGLAIFNANNANTQFVSQKTKQKKLFYKTAKTFHGGTRNTIVGFDITTKTDGVLFSATYKDQTIHLRSDLLGEHVVENMLPAILLGMHFGLSEAQIQKAIATLTPLAHTMQKIVIKKGVIGIDDTFNASPESVAAAKKYLSLFPKRKFFVLAPLIELGKQASERHQEIGKMLADVDYVFVTNKNYFSDMQKGIQLAQGKAMLISGSYQEIADMLARFTQRGDVVLFEGKEAGIVLKKLI